MAELKETGERRRWERLPILVPFFVRGTDTREKQFLEFASAVNVSAGGALITLRRRVKLGAVLSVEIPTAPVLDVAVSKKSVKIFRAEVVHLASAEGAYLVGLKWSNPIAAPRRTKRRS